MPKYISSGYVKLPRDDKNHQKLNDIMTRRHTRSSMGGWIHRDERHWPCTRNTVQFLLSHHQGKTTTKMGDFIPQVIFAHGFTLRACSSLAYACYIQKNSAEIIRFNNLPQNSANCFNVRIQTRTKL